MVKQELRNFRLSSPTLGVLPCAIPNTLVSVLTTEGQIENPILRDRIRVPLPTAGEYCDMSATFIAENGLRRRRHVFLDFSGLVSAAEVLLNGHHLLFAAAHRAYRVDVTSLLVPDDNVLLFHFPAESAPAPAHGSVALSDRGIIGAVALLGTDAALLDAITVEQQRGEEGVVLALTVTTLGASLCDAEELSVVATLVSPGGKVYYGGLPGGVGRMTVPDPELWWPEGLGAQALYHLTVTLYMGDTVEDVREISLGVRSLEMSAAGNRLADDACFLCVNGLPVALRGAELLPDVVFEPRRAAERRQRLLIGCHRAHYNALRWVAAGRLPEESLLTLADRYGILVLCDGARLLSGERSDDGEIASLTGALRQAALHPSFVLLGEAGDMPSALMDACPPLSVGGDGLACHTFAVASLPSLRALRAFAGVGDMNLFSEVMELHTPDADALSHMLTGIRQRYRYPTSLQELCYVSALVQRDALQDAVRASCCGGGAAGVLFRAANDEWPSVSTAAVDWFGQAKAVQFAARGLFAPVTVIHTVSAGGVTLTAVNRTRRPYEGTLTYSLMGNDNRILLEESVRVCLPPLATQSVVQRDLSAYLSERERDVYLAYRLTDGHGEMVEGTAFFVPPKHFHFLDPAIRTQISGAEREYELTLCASAYAASVELSFTATDVVPERNYFDLTRNTPTRVHLTVAGATTAERLMRELTVRSLYGMGGA